MDITNTLRIRCAQLGPPPQQQQQQDGDTSLDGDKDAADVAGGSTRKHEPLDVLHSGPRSDGLVPTCDEFDMCGSCFCEGKEMGRHKRWHDYRVVVSSQINFKLGELSLADNLDNCLDATRLSYIYGRLGRR